MINDETISEMLEKKMCLIDALYAIKDLGFSRYLCKKCKKPLLETVYNNSKEVEDAQFLLLYCKSR